MKVFQPKLNFSLYAASIKVLVEVCSILQSLEYESGQISVFWEFFVSTKCREIAIQRKQGWIIFA